MQRLTKTTIACYGLLMFAGAAPLEVPALQSQDGAPKASAATTDTPSQDCSLLPEGAKRIAATHHHVDLY